MKRVQKVVAYVTRGDQLLVLRHRDFPEIGIEVPAGTVEPGEDLAEAVLREVEEETGLTGVRMIGYLGTADFHAHMFDEMHERHFFHLESTDETVADEWLHYEMHPSGGDRTPVAYILSWTPTKGADLFWEKGALLHKLPSAVH